VPFLDEFQDVSHGYVPSSKQAGNEPFQRSFERHPHAQVPTSAQKVNETLFVNSTRLRKRNMNSRQLDRTLKSNALKNCITHTRKTNTPSTTLRQTKFRRLPLKYRCMKREHMMSLVTRLLIVAAVTVSISVVTVLAMIINYLYWRPRYRATSPVEKLHESVSFLPHKRN
jgi:hypothetical protein